MNNIRLYDIASQYKTLLDCLYDPETGEVNEEAYSQLKDMNEPLEKKCIAIASYIENLDAERKAIEEHKKRIAERESRYKKQVSSMKEYLQINMEKANIKKISCPLFDITLCKNPPSVNIVDENEIPPDYNKAKIELDTARIRKELMEGVVIPGVNLVQKYSLRIK